MILVIDNYDSFTYNIVQELGELGAELCVMRNDQIDVAGVRDLNPSHVVISPGPGFPKDSGVSPQIIRELGPTIPTLGVCLGHQAIGEIFGATVSHASRQMHGKTSLIHHEGDPLFEGLSNPFTATRYHSLVILPETMPAELRIIARADSGEIMGVRHEVYPIVGVQFHPESILTDGGIRILQNFLAMQPAIV